MDGFEMGDEIVKDVTEVGRCLKKRIGGEGPKEGF